MLRYDRARVVLLSGIVLIVGPDVARSADDREVDAAIQKGIAALLDRINPNDEIEYVSADDPPKTHRAIGRILKKSGGYIRFQTTDGKTLSIPQSRIAQILPSGHIQPEMNSYHRGGPSALAALALVSAGVETTDPRLSSLLDALAGDPAAESGTYVHSLRAATWSALLDRPLGRASRVRFRKLLSIELKWLLKAMLADGGFGYTQSGAGGWDHSNTQFGHLGLWSVGVAKIEIERRSLQMIAHHWLETQTDTGGWGYRNETFLPTSSMTVAGCNSLYIALDQLYARSGGPYRLFEGIKPDKKAEEPIQKIGAAIARGDDFLRRNAPNPLLFSGYELFGLERLGLASGRSTIGGVDWYRHYVDNATRQPWTLDPISDAFALIFLVHGQAPVIIQRMTCGNQDREAGYYFRDLANLSRFFSRTFERLHRWQRIPVDADLRELQDAPLLYLSGRGPLELPDATIQRIREYLDGGGTVFLHADGASKKFVSSATKLFERMFSDREFRFAPLDESHPVYHCHFGAGQSKWKQRAPLHGLSDGSRVMVFLCPVDIAGAWHQDRGGFDDLFRIMANVRVYAAPPYADLPRRLRRTRRDGPPAPPAGSLRLLRMPYAGNWEAHPGAWRRFLPGLRHRTGIDLVVQPPGNALDAPTMATVDLVHLTVQKRPDFAPPSLEILKNYLQNGGLLLLDAADGRPAGIQAVSEALDQIDVGDKGVLPTDHEIFSGAFRGGRPLGSLEATDVGAALTRGGAPPPILTRTIDGRVAVLACPFDLVAGIDGHFIWHRSGYSATSTERIVDNILLWRRATKSPPSKKSP